MKSRNTGKRVLRYSVLKGRRIAKRVLRYVVLKGRRTGKRVLRYAVLALVSLFAIHPSAFAAIAHTAHGGATGGTHNATSIAVSVTAAAGESIIVYCASNTACSSVTDNASPANTYTAGPTQSTNKLVAIFYSLNIANAPTAVTVTVSGTESSAAAETYTGVQAIGNTGTNSGSSTAPAVTVTTQDANNWVVMCGGDSVATSTSSWSASAPNTVWHSVNSASTGGYATVASLDGGAVASPGSATVTGTLSVSETWGAVGLELRSTLPSCAQSIALVGVGCR